MLSFLSGGGEMGERIRSHPWDSTTLGPPIEWPQSLKTLVAVMLGSSQPMFLTWGEPLTTLYNDGYAAILGGKHPRALGRPLMETWAEITTELQPFVDRTLAGTSVRTDDFSFVMNRHGYDEEAHFTFSYTPLRDEKGEVVGFFCACQEITEQISVARQRAAETERLRELFQQAPGFMAILRGPELIFEVVNEAYQQLVGPRAIVGLPLRQALPDIADQGFFELVENVYRTGETFTGRRMPVLLQREAGGTPERAYIDLVYQAIRDGRGAVSGVFVEGADVTERVRADEALRNHAALHRQIVDSAFDYAIISSDRQGLITSWNAGARAILGWTEQEMLGQSAHRFFTDEDNAANRVDEEMRRALQTGRCNDERWHLRKGGQRFWALGEMTPLRDGEGHVVGFVKILRDRTEQRRTERALLASAATLRESEAKFRALAQAVPHHVWTATTDGLLDWFNDRVFAYSGLSYDHLVGERWLRIVHPDDREAAQKAWAASLASGTLYETEFRMLDGDGRYRWHLVRAEPVVAEEGVVRWVGANTDIEDHKHALSSLAELKDSLQSQVEARTQDRDRMWRLSTDVMLVAKMDGTMVAVNPAWTGLLGWSEDELVGMSFFDLVHPDDRSATIAETAKLAHGEKTLRFENRCCTRKGEYRALSWAVVPDASFIHAVGRDVTAERETAEALRQTESALRQAQKMEAVGQLTGGIAHDFNNLLQGITGSLDLVQKRIAQGRFSELERFVTGAKNSANRAAALTHRLLAFSRRQPLDPKPVRSNPLVASMEEMLRRTLGEKVELELVLAAGLWQTLCDPNQLESAILNLAINARDAMPDGGKLTIETCNAHLDTAYAAKQRDVKPGQYICICVTDTGTGMSADTAAKAFEPFFTTKPLGQGTGLGLSMIYGFARQSEGYAKIYSEVGKGTTFKLYLPRHRGSADDSDALPALGETHLAEEGETVLVVEDEPVVRGLIVEVLGELGYHALEASDGPSGLAILQSKRRIDLLVTDIGLPGLNGRQVADAGRALRPELKVLFMTGYAENAALASGFLEHGMTMITKPFAIEALATRIREIIEGR